MQPEREIDTFVLIVAQDPITKAAQLQTQNDGVPAETALFAVESWAKFEREKLEQPFRE